MAQIHQHLGEYKITHSADVQDVSATVDAVKAILVKAGIEPGANNAVLGLPDAEVIVRYFEMPILPKNERRSAVHFEAQKYISLETRDLYHNYDIFVDRIAQRMKVVFVAAKKEFIDAKIQVAKEAGLKIIAIEPSAVALSRAASPLPSDKEEGVMAVVEVDFDGSMHISLMKNHMLLLLRDCQITLSKDMPADLECAGLINELRITLNYFYKNFKGEKVKRLILCTEPELTVRGWDAILRSQFDFAIHLGTLAGKTASKPGGIGPGVLIAAGLAIRDLDKNESARPNLIPELTAKDVERTAPMAPAEEKKILQKWALIALSGIFAAMLIGHLFLITKINQVKASGLTLQTLEELQAEQEAIGKKLEFFDKTFQNRIYLTLKMNELARAVPAEINLVSLDAREVSSGDGVMPKPLLRLEWTVPEADPGQALLISNRFISALRQNREWMRGFTQIRVGAARSTKTGSIFQAECQA